MDTAAELYEAFLKGDEESFVKIIDLYKNNLIFYLNGFVSDYHTAEDLTEDTFLKILIKKPKFKGKSKFKTWLFAIGRNVALDYLRKNKKSLKDVPLEEYMQDNKKTPDGLEKYLKTEERIAVQRALVNLKIEYRQVLVLSFFEGLENKEIAVVMKKTVHGIETMMYRAKQALKIELEREGFEYERV